MSKPLYVLSSYAEEQFATLLYGIAEHSGWKRSMDVEERLYAAFREIGLQPGIGHIRSDLASRKLLFFYTEPYYILYVRTPRLSALWPSTIAPVTFPHCLTTKRRSDAWQGEPGAVAPHLVVGQPISLTPAI